MPSDMKILWAGGVVPQYGQVAIWDAETDQYPEWTTGNEKACATDHCVVVATRPDWGQTGAQGVAVEVWTGTQPPKDEGFRRVFIGLLVVGGHGVRVGNHPSGDLHDLAIPNGCHLLEVWTDIDFGGPSNVQFRFPR